MDEEHIPTNGTENQIKGAAYELQILDLIRQTQPAYLWPHTPEPILVENGIIGSHNAARLKRKEERANPLQQDTGIDIIAMSSETECYLVQCKNGYKHGVSMNDLAGFWGWMASLPDKQGVVYYTDRLSLNVRTLPIINRIKYIREPFDTSYMPNTYAPVQEPEAQDQESADFTESAESVVFIPDPEKLEYQQAAKQAAIEYFAENDNGILSMPCGTGKTFTAYLIAQEFQYIYITSPLKEFAKQNLDRFVEYGYPRENTLLVDSDGCRDPELIKKFMSDRVGSGFLISATFDSVDVLWKVIEPQQETKSVAKTLFITDEFHNLSLANIQDEDDDFNKIITMPGIKKLFMSATPRVYELEDQGETGDYLLGERIYDMSFKYAIEHGFITDYRIWVPSIHEDLTELHTDIRRELGVNAVLGTDNILYSKAIYLFSCLVNTGSRKCIVYCQDTNEITQFRSMVSQLNEYWCLDINTSQITSVNSASSRREILQGFASSTRIELLFSVRILDECIDIPTCDSIYITYPSKSKIRTIQRLMRCTRTIKSNKHKVGNLFLWCSEYESILETLGGIKEIDAGFADKVIVNQVSQFTGKGAEKPTDVSDDIDECRKLVIGAKEFRYVTWNEKLELVKKYIDENKKRPLQKDKDPKIRILGRWLSNQLSKYIRKKEIMSDPTIYSLWTDFITSIQYSEYFIDNITAWNNKLAELKKYIDTNKIRPSSSSKDQITKSLGLWTLLQTKNYPSKSQIMDNPNIYSVWSDFIGNPIYSEYFIDNNTAWNNKLAELKTYIDSHKERPNQRDKDTKIRTLGVWVCNQLNNYSKKKDIMKDPDIYLAWTTFVNHPDYSEYFIDNNTKWTNTLAELKVYLDANKMRPNKESKNQYIKTLGKWIGTQITNYTNKEQIMADPNIYAAWTDFITSQQYAEYFIDKNTVWNSTLSELKYYLDTNKIRPSQKSNDPKIKTLAQWLSNQRIKYSKKENNMSDPTIYSAWTDFITSPQYSEYFIDNKTMWNNTLAELKAYLNTNKKRPSSKSKDMQTRTLGLWVCNQIKNYSKEAHIMSDPTINSAWTEFITHQDYKQYFE